MVANSNKKRSVPSLWVVQRTNADFISYLSNASSISPALAQVLINRGIKTPGEVKDFVAPSVKNMLDPFAIDGISTALNVIDAARKNSTRVLVHGDYDTDGVTATAIMVEALRRFGLEVFYYIPNRFQDGYGFNVPAVRKAKDMGAGLIITVDCGISSFEATEYAKEQGIGVIITDHHEPAKETVTEDGVVRPLPGAAAVINPKLSSPGVSDLSGAGVALKVAQALTNNDPCHEFLDLAALGTLADSVPLMGENRIIVKEGLARIKEGGRPGIKALKAVSRLDDRYVKAGTLCFTVVPRINAAGRISDASEVVDLLLLTSEDKAMDIAASLERKNSERQRIEENVYTEALEQLNRRGYGAAIVLSGEDWHEGVIGIVAARIAEKFYRPAFVFSIKGDVAKGSARSTPEFDIYRGLTESRNILISFGGHKGAAGLKLKVSDMDSFEKAIADAVRRQVNDFTPTLRIDADISLRDVNFNLIKELQMLEPFGAGNSEPVFGSRDLEVINPRVVGNNHLKMKLKCHSQVMDAIGFEMGDFCKTVETLGPVDAAYTATINEWEGGRALQVKLKALREAAAPRDKQGKGQ